MARSTLAVDASSTASLFCRRAVCDGSTSPRNLGPAPLDMSSAENGPSNIARSCAPVLVCRPAARQDREPGERVRNMHLRANAAVHWWDLRAALQETASRTRDGLREQPLEAMWESASWACEGAGLQRGETVLTAFLACAQRSVVGACCTQRCWTPRLCFTAEGNHMQGARESLNPPAVETHPSSGTGSLQRLRSGAYLLAATWTARVRDSNPPFPQKFHAPEFHPSRFRAR